MRRYFIIVIVFWLAYAALTLLAPATRAVNQYRINLVEINLLRTNILIPLLLIWLSATFAAVKFNDYATLVRNSAEGPAYNKLTKGLVMLLAVLILPSFVSLVGNFYPGSVMVEKVGTIVRVYINIVFYLLAFWYLFQGTLTLKRTLGLLPQKRAIRQRRWAGVIVGVVGIIYAWAIFNNQFRTISADPSIRPTYFLPDWLIVSTVFLPYLIIWLWGMWSVINAHAYGRQVSGIIFQKAFRSLTRGLTASVVLLIGLQFLTQATTVFGRASLSVVLIIVYLVIMALAVSYVFLARGAKQLTSIEEV